MDRNTEANPKDSCNSMAEETDGEQMNGIDFGMRLEFFPSKLM